MSILALTLVTLLLLGGQTLAQDAGSDPSFGIVQTHFFDYPLTKKEYQHWETLGASVIHKSKVVIVPETRDKKGIFYSTEPNPHEDSWLADI